MANLNTPMTITLWTSHKGTAKRDINMTWAQFGDWLAELPRAQVKDSCKLIKLAKFGDEKTEKGALRTDSNVLEVTGIEGDYDDEVMTPEEALVKLEQYGLIATIAPTFTSTPEKPRWRVLTPLSEPVTPSERLRYVEALNGILGGVLARESATLSQSYYVGVPESADYTVKRTFDDPTGSKGVTLDVLGMTGVSLEDLRVSFRSKASNTAASGADPFDDSGWSDWVQDLVSCDAIHPALVRIAAHCVAKGWDDDEIKLLFVGLADRVAEKRGRERADLMLGQELDDAINSARAKGYAPRPFAEILADAQALEIDSDPEQINKIIQETAALPPIEKRRAREAIKRGTKLPFSVMEEAESCEPKEDDVDDLELAQSLTLEIGHENVLATDTFVWAWRSHGVWEIQEDRSVKQWVQRHIKGKVEKIQKSRVDSVTDLFKTDVYKPNHEFDVAEDECVNTMNGELVLELGNWKLLPHEREHYRTTQIPIEYDPTATAPRFNQFMEEAFAGDADAKEKRRALLELIGYSLMAHCNHEKFVILVGTGANGKSVLLSVLEALLGSHNVSGVQPSQFDRTFQRAHMHGKLANIVTEVKQGEMIDDASLKGIVSGEPTTVEHKFKDPFVMRPFATCWFGTNHMPHTRDFSDALFRRALVVEFNNTFKPELGNCDPQLKNKLMAELPGILDLALEAYSEALIFGFTMPASCKEARERWRLEADQVAQFVESECEEDAGSRIPPQQLFNAYRSWAEENGIQKRLTQRSFLDRLVMLGFKRLKSGGVRYITGVKCERIYKPFESWD